MSIVKLYYESSCIACQRTKQLVVLGATQFHYAYELTKIDSVPDYEQKIGCTLPVLSIDGERVWPMSLDKHGFLAQIKTALRLTDVNEIKLDDLVVEYERSPRKRIPRKNIDALSSDEAGRHAVFRLRKAFERTEGDPRFKARRGVDDFLAGANVEKDTEHDPEGLSLGEFLNEDRTDG